MITQFNGKTIKWPDPLIPDDFLKLGIISKAGIDSINSDFSYLVGKTIEELPVPENSDDHPLNAATYYTQGHLRRALQLGGASWALATSGMLIPALTITRSLFESVANMKHFSEEFCKITPNADREVIMKFVYNRSQATRSQEMLDIAQTEDVKAVNILTQFNRLVPVRGSVKTDYEYLCELAHPNGLGSTLFFSDFETSKKLITFTDLGRDVEEHIKFVCVGLHMLTYFRKSMDEVIACAESWAPRPSAS